MRLKYASTGQHKGAKASNRGRGSSRKRKKVGNFNTIHNEYIYINIKFGIVGNGNLGPRRRRGRASISIPQKMSENGPISC